MHHHRRLDSVFLVGSVFGSDAGSVADCRRLVPEAVRRLWFVGSTAVAELRRLGSQRRGWVLRPRVERVRHRAQIVVLRL